MIKVEVRHVSFVASQSETVTFETAFDTKHEPIVKVVGEPTGPGVNLFISNITKTAVTIGASGKWTGTAHLHIISKD